MCYLEVRWLFIRGLSFIPFDLHFFVFIAIKQLSSFEMYGVYFFKMKSPLNVNVLFFFFLFHHFLVICVSHRLGLIPSTCY